MGARISLCIILYFTSFLYASAPLTEAIRKAEQDLAEVRNKNTVLLSTIEQERNKRTAQIRTARQRLREARRQRELVQGRLQRLRRSREELARTLAETTFTVHKLKNNIIEKTRNLYSTLQISPTAAQYHADLAALRNLLSAELHPDRTYVEKIAGVLFQELRRAGSIQKYHGDYYLPDGTGVQGDIIRIGKLGAVYRDAGDNCGLLSYAPASRYLYTLDLPLKSAVKKSISRCFQKTGMEHTVYPVDIAGGAAFRQMKSKKSFIGHIKSGGIIVYPILAIGIAAFIMVIERCVVLFRQHSRSAILMPRVLPLVRNAEWTAAAELCRKYQGAAARICAAGIEYREKDKAILEDVLQEAILKELPLLERFLPALRVFAGVTPLLGLLGTVTGMIVTFDVIAIFGSGDPRLMSGGISEALVTTELGLIVAVPILLLHSFLAGRVSQIVRELEKIAVTLVNLISLEKTERP